MNFTGLPIFQIRTGESNWVELESRLVEKRTERWFEENGRAGDTSSGLTSCRVAAAEGRQLQRPFRWH